MIKEYLLPSRAKLQEEGELMFEQLVAPYTEQIQEMIKSIKIQLFSSKRGEASFFCE